MNRDVFILNEAESHCLICCWKGCLAIEWLWEWWWICWEYRVTVRTGQLEVKQLDRNHHHHHRRIRGSYNYCSHQYGLVILQALLGPSCQYRSPLLAFIFPPNPHALLLLAVGWKFWWKFPLWRDQPAGLGLLGVTRTHHRLSSLSLHSDYQLTHIDCSGENFLNFPPKLSLVTAAGEVNREHLSTPVSWQAVTQQVTPTSNIIQLVAILLTLFQLQLF